MTVSLMERFASPEFFASLPLGDKLVGAGITTLMGMGSTFVVLILIWGCIVVMSKLAALSRSGKKQPTAPLSEIGAPCAEDGTLLAAVIIAAVAAAEGGEAGTFTVRRITRLSGPGDQWSAAGRLENRQGELR